jgi:Secretion system C-terminal sorting domain
MRTIFRLTSLISLILLTLAGRSQTYFFSVSQEPFEPIGTGFPLTEGIWDDPGYEVPIGFEFQLFDDVVTTLVANEFFTGGAVANDLSGSTASIIQVYGPDIIDRGYETGGSMSAILFKTTGTAGDRVFTQEWYNVGFWNGELVNNVYVDYIHFQLKLYEASGDIVFHFGPSSITNPQLDYEDNPGPGLGIVKNLDLFSGLSAEETLLLTGNPSSPTVVTEIADVYLNGSIPENTVYRFSRNPTAVKDPSRPQPGEYFYPNPTSGNLSIKADLMGDVTFPISVFNANGQMTKTISGMDDLSFADMPSGMYELRIPTTDGIKVQRIVVMP